MTQNAIEDQRIPKPRAEWRQRLVDAEWGLRAGMRADSTLFVYYFVAGVVVLTSLVVGLLPWEWAMLGLSLGFALSAELLHQFLKQFAREYEWFSPDLFRMGTSAVVVAHLTAAGVSLFLLWPHFSAIWKH